MGSSATPVFENCTNLITLSIGNNVTKIPAYAFMGCSSLTSVTIPDSVTYIGNYAFSGCSGLTTVNFNATNCTYMGSINERVFNGCTNLTILNIGANVTMIPDYAFGYSNLTGSLTIPNSVTSIGKSAFSACIGLTSVTIPNSVTSIGVSAFYNCSGLTSVTIPNSVTYIGRNAFQDCSGLTSVTIPNSVTYIGSEAFENCSGLTGDLTIPNSVTSIGGRAFYNCSGLTTVNFNATNCTSMGSYQSGWYRSAFDGCTNLATLNIGENVTRIPNNAFRNLNSLTGALTIPNSVTSIGDTAFSGCSGLTSVTIGGSVTSIGVSAFSTCIGLTSVTIPNSVTSIGSLAFSRCSILTTVTIPNSVTYIGSEAFENCSGLTRTNYTGSLRQWCGINFSSSSSNPTYYSYNLFINDTNINATELVIPNGTTKIKKYVFEKCNAVKSLTIPSSVTTIDNSAFEGCSGLDTVYFNATNMNDFSSTPFGSSPLKLFITGDNVQQIPANICKGRTSLRSVTIGSGVTSIGNSSFANCSGITELTFKRQQPPVIGDNAFSGVPTSCTVYIPCGTLSLYMTRLPNFANFVEQELNFSAESEDESKGTVQILNEPTCTNPNAVLNAVPASSYRFDHWSTGSTDNPYTFNVTGAVTVIAYFVSDGSTEGIDDVNGDGVQVYAVGGRIVIEGAENERVQVFNMMGQAVDSKTLPSGIYIVKIGTRPARKVVVIR